VSEKGKEGEREREREREREGGREKERERERGTALTNSFCKRVTHVIQILEGCESFY